MPGLGGGGSEIGSGLTDAVFDDGAPVFPGQIRKVRTEVPVGVRSRMLASGHGLIFCPGEQLVCRDHHFPDLTGLSACHLHLFH